MEEVGRKLYLSETPSIGWEAKTLGAKRRISSSEIATVPGTLDLVELLFSAVLMLVDWLVGCGEPQQRGEALGAAGVFSTFGGGSKSGDGQTLWVPRCVGFHGSAVSLA